MTELFFSIFEYAASCFEGFIIVKFLFDYCGFRFSQKTKGIALFLSQILFSGFIILSNRITSFESIGVFAYAVVLFVIAAFLLGGTWIQKAFVSIFAILCAVMLAGTTMPLVAAASNIPLSEIYGSVSFKRAIGVVITKIALYLIFKAFISPNKPRKDILLTNAEWIQVILVSACSMFVTAFVIDLQLQYIVFPMDMGVVFIIIGTFALDLYFLYVVLKINRYNRIKQENELLKQQQIYCTKYAESVQRQYEEVKALRHDWKHSLSVLEMLLREDKNEEAAQFIHSHGAAIESPSLYIDTSNEFLNAIVNSKLSQAYQHRIKTSCAVSSACEQIDGIDLCNLLGNLLDNAIEGIQKSPCNNAEIILQISQAPGKIFISVKNSIATSVLSQNSKLQTNKTNKQDHGFGMKTIQSIVEKYNGLIDIYEEDHLFCVLVTLFI